MRYSLLLVVFAVLAVQVGCDMEMPEERRQVDPGMYGVVTDPGELAKPDKKDSDEAKPDDEKKPDPKKDEENKPPKKDDADVVVEKADVGSGKKGRDYGQNEYEIVAAPIASLFAAREKIAFQVQIPHALKMYQATNGYFPKTQKEFEDQILKPNGVKLPELRPGDKYKYDPEKGELLVLRRVPKR